MSAVEERWERARTLFDAARGLPPSARDEYLASACDDAGLRAEVVALLNADAALHGGAVPGFLELDPRRAGALIDGAASDGSPPEPLAPGERVGGYRVLRRLGSGGMGVVYLAEDVRLHRAAALKLLPPHLAVDAAARRRFEEEARAASALDHPNIVTVYGLEDTADGRPFMAMALVEGETLGERLARGPLPLATALSIAEHITDGLAAAHRRGIVHRDIKPRNIVITAEGVAKIVDFGIATTRQSAPPDPAATPGTLAYMSPEQTRGEPGDARSDVWALGVLLHEMCCGRRPFTGEDAGALVEAIRGGAASAGPARGGMPRALARIIERCLEPDPHARYPDAAAVRTALRAHVTHAGSRLRRAVPVAAALVVLAGAAAIIGSRGSSMTRLEARRVAVGAIENRSGSPEFDVYAEMATEWITHGLWQTGAIEVVELGTLAGDSEAASPRALARGAGARLLLTGGLYGSGDQLRLQARVADVASGRVVASVEPVGTSAASVMDAVDELRERVQQALYPRLDTQLMHIRAVQRPPRFEAYVAYRAGRDAHARRELPAALRHFQEAAALDSSFMLPHVISAIVLNMMGDFAAADSIARALQRQPDRLDRFSLAHVNWLRASIAGDREGAYAAMAEAARLAPGSTLPGVQAADEAFRLGRAGEAMARLTAFEPERGELRGWMPYWQTLAAALHARGRHRRELEVAQRACAVHPDDPRARILLLQALAALGRTTAIERELDEAVRQPSRGEPSAGAQMLHVALELRAHAGRRERARRDADRILARAIAWYRAMPAAERSQRQQYELTMALAAAGQRSEARRLLEALVRDPPAGRAGPSPFASAASPNYPDAVAYHGALGVLAAGAGAAAAADAELAWLREQTGGRGRGRPLYWRAAIAGALGREAEAESLLRAAFDEGMPFQLALHIMPELAPLRRARSMQPLLRPRD